MARHLRSEVTIAIHKTDSFRLILHTMHNEHHNRKCLQRSFICCRYRVKGKNVFVGDATINDTYSSMDSITVK